MHTCADVRRGWHVERPRRLRRGTWCLLLLAGVTVWGGGGVWCSVWSSDPESPVRRTYTVLIDLSKQDTYVTIPGSAARTFLCDVEADPLPSSYQLIPAAGVVRIGQPVDIVLVKSPGVRIRLSIVHRGQELAARVSPLIDIGRANPVEFTHDRIKRTLWSFQRRVKDLQRQIRAAQREYHQIDTWLATPGNKPLYLHKAVRLRQKLLAQQLAAYQQELPAAQSRYASFRDIIELASGIHATTAVRFTAEVGTGS